MGAARQERKGSAHQLFFSEYVEGSGNSKALEIYNGTGAPVDLNANGYAVFFSFSSGTSTRTIPLLAASPRATSM